MLNNFFFNFFFFPSLLNRLMNVRLTHPLFYSPVEFCIRVQTSREDNVYSVEEMVQKLLIKLGDSNLRVKQVRLIGLGRGGSKINLIILKLVIGSNRFHLVLVGECPRPAWGGCIAYSETHSGANEEDRSVEADQGQARVDRADAPQVWIPER
jgi:hypothetical protein